MIRWGIIGAGRIANRFVKALEHERDSVLYAVSCRTQEKADAFAEKHGNPIAYAGFENILKDENVDAVYLATPHAYHKEWIIRCLKAGKPVLCEKPLCLNEEEVDEIIAVSQETGVLCMEAMKTRFVPLYSQIRKTVNEGVIGTVTGIETSFCSQADLSVEGRYYTDPVGGGSLLDGGIYNAAWIEDYAPADLHLDSLHAIVKNEVDIYTEAVLKSDSFTAVLECAFDRNRPKNAVIHGTKGTIVVENLHRPVKAEIIADNEHRYTIEKPYEYDDFYSQIHHFVTLIQQGKKESDVVPLSVSKRCAHILDIIAKGYRYDEHAIELLEKQEETLQYASFDYSDAMKLVNTVLKLQKEYDRTVSVSVYDEEKNLEIIRVLQDGKTEANLMYMNGKRNAAKDCGHSSLYAYVQALVHNETPAYDREHCPSGGAFPIRVNGEWKYTVAVSGLHEGKDHEIMIRALEAVLNRKCESFPYMMV